MMDLLMLGIIPGTDIQIGFESWLMVSALFVGSVLVVLAYRKRRTLAAICRPAARFVSRRAWLLVLRMQLAWQLRRSVTLF